MALAAVLLLTSAAECKKSSGSGGANNQCDTQVEAPTYENLAGKDAIAARSSSSCDMAPATHKVTLRLEYQTKGGNWIAQNTNPQEPYGICEELPGPGHSVKCQWILYMCLDGKWRTRATASGRGDKGDGMNRDFFFEVPERPEANIKCPRG